MKKLISLVLVATLFLGFTFPATARSKEGKEIGELQDSVFQDRLGNPSIAPERTHPGDEIILPIMNDGIWDINNARIDWSGTGDLSVGPTVAQLKANKVVPRILMIKGDDYIRDISLQHFTPTSRIHARAAVRIRFVEDLDSSKEIPYRFTVYLSLDGTSTEAEATFSGMVRNEIYDVANLDYVYIGDGSLADCSAPSMNVELDLGNGVSVFRDMFPEERFYGRATQDTNRKQDTVLETYPDIRYIYDLHTIDVKFNGKVVQLTEEANNPTEYFVYNANGEYIGTSHERLPFSSRYYLSQKEIEIDPALIQKLPEYVEEVPTMGAALRRFVDGVKEETAQQHS